MPDTAYTPTLIIGLGGTGLKAATLIKKSLLEMNRNTVPANVGILVIDTEREIKYQAGGWGRERSGAHATGPVKISDFGEYVPIVGNVRALGETIMDEELDVQADPGSRRRQPHRHISPWFQANYYLTEFKVDDAVWNLEVGAGRLRQFGRLGLYSRLNTVNDLFRNALQSIRSQGAATVYTHIVGSLAGGTGSALFADVAHLVKQIASTVGFTQSPIVFGHFVLAEAFSGTPEVKLGQPGNREDFDARALAALRELTRLQGVTPAAPYPMIYDPRGAGELSAKIDKPLYAAVYLYDGVRANNSLRDRAIEQGIAPTIADAVVSYIDTRSAGAFTSHSVNYKSFYGAYKIPADMVTYGSIGTYTIELPIYHIVEGWSHDLAREALDVMLDPREREPQTEAPLSLCADMPGGQKRDPNIEADRFLKEDNTALVDKLADWGRAASSTSVIRDQKVDEVLGLNEQTWQQLLAPGDAEWQAWVAEAQADLEGNLRDAKSKYYIDHRQAGGSSEQKALNLQTDTDRALRAMLGETLETWQRSGGDVGKSLQRLAMHHVAAYTQALIRWLGNTLNGSANTADAIERKRGKLGHALAFIERVDTMLKVAYNVLALGKDRARTMRRPLFDGIAAERSAAFKAMNRGGGFLDGNYRNYRDKSDELAQFHKADIARDVVLKLVEALQVRTEEALKEVQIWERALAVSKVSEGGAYALILDGKREISVDRNQARNAVRWVIDDNEPGDQYIANKRQEYLDGDESLKQVLQGVEWKVSQVDERGPLKIEFTFGNQAWDRRAGENGQQTRGVRNVSNLLLKCRAVFEKAWTDMSVTSYLRDNFASTEDVEKLARRVYESTEPLLSLRVPEYKMRTSYMRVFKDRLDNDGLNFLRSLKTNVSTFFRETTNAEQRINAAREGARLRGEEGGGEDYVVDSGQASLDPFKLTFVMFGDLNKPEDIRAFTEAVPRYRSVSNAGQQWRTLHILPAETNVLEMERELTTGSQEWRQRRRELVEDVTRVMEDHELFSLAMRCLAYGDEDYNWNLRDASGAMLKERGQLLHKFTPRDENGAGHSYWRITLQPAGERNLSDGRVYDAAGRLAMPESIQLSGMESEPDLLKAFVRFVVAQSDFKSNARIDFLRIESTLERLKSEHREQWRKREDRGWMPAQKTSRDAGLLAEAEDKAAQIIRLSAFIAKSEEELGKHRWAWVEQREQGGLAVPNDMQPQQAVETQRYIDLWTALRLVALREMENLQKRFRNLASWNGSVPRERIDIRADVAREEETTPDGVAPAQTTASSSPNAAQPDAAGAPALRKDEGRPAPTVPATESAVALRGLEAQLQNIERQLKDGMLQQDEYDEMVADVRRQMDLLRPPATQPLEIATPVISPRVIPELATPEPIKAHNEAPTAPMPPPISQLPVAAAAPLSEADYEDEKQMLALMHKRNKLTDADYQQQLSELEARWLAAQAAQTPALSQDDYEDEKQMLALMRKRNKLTDADYQQQFAELEARWLAAQAAQTPALSQEDYEDEKQMLALQRKRNRITEAEYQQQMAGLETRRNGR